MLLKLEIENFAIIKHLQLTWRSGMSCITGETGAGKSLLLDSLELVLARRKPRTGELADGCKLTAIFDISQLGKAQSWLMDHKLTPSVAVAAGMALEGARASECAKNSLVHRIVVVQRIWQNGRVHNSINQKSCSQAHLKELGALLLQIYGQHQYYQLMDARQHLRWLDEYADNQQLLEQIAECCSQWRQLIAKRSQLLAWQQRGADQQELLNFKLQELAQLRLDTDHNSYLQHLQHLQQLQRTGANYQQIMQTLSNVRQLLTDEQHGAFRQLLRAKSELNHCRFGRSVYGEELPALLENAGVQLEEAMHVLDGLLDEDSQFDWEAYQQAERELERIHQVARKYGVEAEQLAQYQQKLQQERAMLEESQAQLADLAVWLQECMTRYRELAEQLTRRRQEVAGQLDLAINGYLQQLGMKGATFATRIAPIQSDQPEQLGAESAEFYLAANMGSELQPMRMVASGGELSRVNLALQTIMGQRLALPTMIFDEVDSGIGGLAAEAVAEVLHELAKHAQVICITHLAQVAVRADQHYGVCKQHSAGQTVVQVSKLIGQRRVGEVARMLAGSQTSELTMAHAAELLEWAMANKGD